MSMRRHGLRNGLRNGLRRSAQDKPPSLNLVSLMDIFTILVFFLMVNASEVEVLETSTAIHLPDSISEEAPEDRVSIEVSHDELLFQGKVIANISDVLAQSSPTIDVLVSALTTELTAKKASTSAQSDDELEVFSGKVTIMGDKELPYELLKRVMLSCQTANYTQIALAVNQTAQETAS